MIKIKELLGVLLLLSSLVAMVYGMKGQTEKIQCILKKGADKCQN